MKEAYPNFRELKPNEIECRVKQATKTGVVVLLYKTARTDMDILDETVGAENWYKEYTDIKGNLYCTVYIWSEKHGAWVGKQDCGVESREDEDGNERKGEASDAMKRACFCWNIGRELYSAPFIIIPCETELVNGRYKPTKNHYYEVADIGYTDRKITKLVITERGKTVYTFPAGAVIKTEDYDPDTRAPEIRAQILALAKGDEERVNTYCRKALKKEFSELNGEELAQLKINIVRKTA